MRNFKGCLWRLKQAKQDAWPLTSAFLVNCDENQLQKELESDPPPIPPSRPADWEAVDVSANPASPHLAQLPIAMRQSKG